ncbi:peptide chain release factor N(5)-glutamine methyltransferase [Candidatus Rhodoluna planktonica]|uniref:Release factor glutamine methyltransferase n=1 Tax=Candidatus Rhodoluna planktonica TaxID=535712 RepID=A0A1D9DZQ2_9MICO|nr:peptide chain release factor N(5)-glutamine methyltransferase [Candidatus Rhodoluna planktonica]AOY56284.1 protein-(glutamine-N5) methyltransferase, release factor-specific [Candidatus Rhodoluna planktonica]
MLLRELLNHAAARFVLAGIDSAQNDAELLAAWALGISRSELQTKLIFDEEIDEVAAGPLIVAFARRQQREPLQHITGRAYFRNLELTVGLGVFVPRPETELIAQLAIDALKADPSNQPVAVDLGTGSGAIALAMATEVPHAQVFAVEKSAAAYEFAKQNFAKYSKIENLIQGDMADAFQELIGKVSVVASNPPYIPNDAVPRDPEVQQYDPALALYGGDDGLDLIRIISARAKELLHPGGFLVIEHADSQSKQVCELLLADGWVQVSAHQDLTFRDRAVSARKL